MSHLRLAQELKAVLLSDLQRQVIAGCLLGDGSLSQSGKHFRLRVEHQARHKEYVDWKFNQLRSICLTAPMFVQQHLSWRFGTIGHPEISMWRQEWYGSGRKEVPASWMNLISPLSLAVWFMDDGNKIHRTVTISVHGFNGQSIEHLEAILLKWGIKSQIHYDGHGSRLYIPTESYQTFERLVKPYVEQVPCMAYKLVRPRRDYTLAPVKAG